MDEFHFVKVNHEPERDVQESHVAEQSCLMDRNHIFHSLCFDEQAALDQNVEPQRLFAGETLVLDNGKPLTDARYAAELQFLDQTPFVDRFNQAGSFLAMHLNRRADDGLSQSSRLSERGVHDFEQEGTEGTEKRNCDAVGVKLALQFINRRLVNV